jgi:hypothetical protein
VFRVLIGIATFFCLVVTLYIVWMLAYWTFPEWVSPHRQFFQTCKHIPTGATVEEARAAMNRYLEVGRTWNPPASLPSGIFGSAIQGVRESRSEAQTRILFIPDAKNMADWCLLYPRQGRIVRVEISPD